MPPKNPAPHPIDERGEDSIDLDYLRSFIGTEYHPYFKEIPEEPVRRLDIHNYAEAIEDDNPLWWDEDYGRKAGFGGIIAPPGFVETAAPNYRSYHVWKGTENLRRMFPFEFPFKDADNPRVVLLSEELLYDRPVKAGDIILGRSKIVDVDLKKSRTNGRLVLVTYEKTYNSPQGEQFARVRWTVAALEHELSQPPANREAAIGNLTGDIALGRRQDISALMPDTTVGHLSQTLSMTMLVKWTAVLWDMGIPHFDAAYMQRAYGLSAPLAHGPLMAALHRRSLTNWLRPEDRIVRHRCEFRLPSIAEDTVTATLRLHGLRKLENGHVLADLSSTMQNQYGQELSSSKVECDLGKR